MFNNYSLSSDCKTDFNPEKNSTEKAFSLNKDLPISNINPTLNIPTSTFYANSVIVYKNDNKILSINAGKVAMKNLKILDVRKRLIYDKSNIIATTIALNDLKAEQEVLFKKITSDDNKVETKKVVF